MLYFISITILLLGFIGFFLTKTKDETWWRHIFDIVGFAVFLGLAAFGVGALTWIAAEVIGFLPYSDRPGPGWVLKPGFPPLEDCVAAFGWAVFGSVISLPYLLALSALRAWAEKQNLQRILRAPLEALIYGFVFLILADSAGWYQAVAPLLVYSVAGAGLLLGLTSGVGLLKPSGPKLRKMLWSSLALLISAGVSYSIYQSVQFRVNDRYVHITTMAWNPSSTKGIKFVKDSGFFDEQDQGNLEKLLLSLKLKGRFQKMGSCGGGGSANPKKIKCFLLIREVPKEALQFPVPDVDEVVIYPSQGHWLIWPENAAQTKESIKVDYNPSEDDLNVRIVYWHGGISTFPISRFKEQLTANK